MQHIKYDLGQVKQGSTVSVTLGSQANVLLMDSGNYRTYAAARGGRFQFTGGLAKRSPVHLTVPNTGHWYVAIDLGGRSGRVKTGASVLPPPRGDLPEIRENRTVLRQFVHTEPQAPPSAAVMEGRVWDVFISHAHEDKAAVARPLADALLAAGVTVWLDELEMKIGDSLRRKIDQGIRSSRFGAVILSPSFFAKGWTQYELDGLVGMSVAGKQVLLPIWHEITRADVMRESASLADKFALTTSDTTTLEIASQIAEVVLESRHEQQHERNE